MSKIRDSLLARISDGRDDLNEIPDYKTVGVAAAKIVAWALYTVAEAIVYGADKRHEDD